MNIPRIIRPKGRRVGAARGPQSEDQEIEAGLCHPRQGSAGFVRFCYQHIKVEDAETKQAVPFVLFPGQRRIVEDLVAGRWLLQLKGRQLGFTTQWAAYILYRIIYARSFRVAVIFQERAYAEEFLVKLKYMYDRLPTWFQPEVTRDNTKMLEFGSTRYVRAMVGSDKAARSTTGDLVLYDEASRIPRFAASLAAAQPALEASKGQIGVLTTSAGPTGDFYTLWQETYGDHGERLDDDGVGPTGFKLCFLHWSERPGRDRAWYEEQKARLDRIGSTVVKQEYPDTPEEAFEYAAGRVYPLFTRDTCIGDISIPSTAYRYRAIDWGETKSAYVVLWIAHIPGPPGFLVSPKCPNTIREFLGYRWDEDRPGEPVKREDHCPDAVRYAVIHWSLTGLVYVYREIYRTDSLAKGWNPMLEIEEIHKASGWVLAEPELRDIWRPSRRGELYYGTVADRSWGKAIALMNANDIPCQGNRPIERRLRKGTTGTDNPLSEVQEGIRMVSAVIDGSIDIEKRIKVSREGAALRVYYESRVQRRLVPHTVGLPERQLQQMARDLLKRRRRRV